MEKEKGFFERSFMFRMIRDFFLLLVIVAILELGLRYVAILYEFKNNEPSRVQEVADKLSNDIRSIMLNAGGPTAARTIYPIIDKNYNDLGFLVAVEPSQITVDSIMVSQNMEAFGLQQLWPSGHHTEAKVDISAEQYCLGCHIKAKVGDILGTVTVRSYFDRKLDVWLEEVEVAAGVLSMNILIHTLVLFLLLKIRMQPLLNLRSTVSNLARGLVDISPRTNTNSEDEFGELATDLNHFLDRITLVVRDLDNILGEVLSVGDRLNVLTKQLNSQCLEMRGVLFPVDREGENGTKKLELIAAREAGAVGSIKGTASALTNKNGSKAKNLNEEFSLLLSQLENAFTELHSGVREMAESEKKRGKNLDRYDLFLNALKEMALLEATMQRVAKNGRETLRRIVRVNDND
jgi:methyl-accepting chemotaxis protein